MRAPLIFLRLLATAHGALHALVICAQAVEKEVGRNQAVGANGCPQGLIPPGLRGLKAIGERTGRDVEARRREAGGDDETMCTGHNDAREKERSGGAGKAPFQCKAGLT